jgi:hypothetical protein
MYQFTPDNRLMVTLPLNIAGADIIDFAKGAVSRLQ